MIRIISFLSPFNHHKPISLRDSLAIRSIFHSATPQKDDGLVPLSVTLICSRLIFPLVISLSWNLLNLYFFFSIFIFVCFSLVDVLCSVLYMGHGWRGGKLLRKGDYLMAGSIDQITN